VQGPAADPKILCEELIVPQGWEFLFVLPEVLTKQPQTMSFDIMSLNGEVLSHVSVDERRQGGECGIRVGMTDGRTLGFVRTDAVHDGHPSGMPEFCRPDGSAFGTLTREDSARSGPGYALRGGDGKPLLIFRGDFRKKRVNVLSAESGQTVCVVERPNAEQTGTGRPEYQAKVGQRADAGLVLCGLLAIDKVEGNSATR